MPDRFRMVTRHAGVEKPRVLQNSGFVDFVNKATSCLICIHTDSGPFLFVVVFSLFLYLPVEVSTFECTPHIINVDSLTGNKPCFFTC
jgi:hypothetical protein